MANFGTNKHFPLPASMIGWIDWTSDRPRLSQEQPWPRLSKADGPGGDGIAGAYTTIGH